MNAKTVLGLTLSGLMCLWLVVRPTAAQDGGDLGREMLKDRALREKYDVLKRDMTWYSNGVPDPAEAAKLASRVQEFSSTRQGLALLMEDPQISVDSYVAGNIKVKGIGGLNAEVGTAGGKVALDINEFSKVGAGVGDKKVEMFTSSSVPIGKENKISLQSSAEANFASNQDLYSFLPLPGLRHMVNAAERVNKDFTGEVPDPGRRADYEARESLSRVLMNSAERALDEAKRSMGWVAPTSFGLKSTASYESGPVTISAAKCAAMDTTRAKDYVRFYNESSFSLELGVEGVPKLGNKIAGAGGKFGITFTISDDPRAEGVDVRRLEIARALREGRPMGEVMEKTAEYLNPFRVSEEGYKQVQKLKEGRKTPGLGPDRVVATEDPEVGGVRLSFDPQIAVDGVSSAEFGEVLEQLARAEKQHKNFQLGPSTTVEGVVLVPIEAVLSDSAGTLGGLTRVRGYVLDGKGGLSLAGLREPGKVAIPRDDLVVALRSMYREGLAPYVSLDQNPADPGGPQKSRVGGLARGLEHTDFIHAMLEADYLMKRIDLGEFEPDVPGFQPGYRLLQQMTGDLSETFTRMWFTPLVAPCGDVVVTREGQAEALWYESRVQVQTETMRRAGSALMGTGEVTPYARDSAANFTRYFPQLCEAYGCAAFARLRQVFDVAKLCAILRARGVAHETLDKLANLTPARVPHKAHFDGIGPKLVSGTLYTVSGGAMARVRVNARANLKGDYLAPLLAASRDGKRHGLSFKLPAVITIDPSQAENFDVELQANAALADMMDDRNEDALPKLDAALRLDPEHSAALCYRALCRTFEGDHAGALADISLAHRQDPELAGLRAFIAALAGQSQAGIEFATQAETRSPDDPDVLCLCASARMYAFDFAGAERVTNRVLSLSPLDVSGRALRTELSVLYKLVPEEARRRVKAFAATPFAVAIEATSAQTSMAGMDVVGAAEHFLRALERLKAKPETAAAREVYLRELLLLNVAFTCDSAADKAAKQGDQDTAARLRNAVKNSVAELRKDHPDWPMAMLLGAGLPHSGLSGQERLDALKQASALDFSKDPLCREMNMQMGSSHSERLLALQVLEKTMGQFNDEKQVFAVLDLLTKFMGDSPAAALFRWMGDLARRFEGRTEKPTPEEEKALRDEFLTKGRTLADALIPEKFGDAPDPVEVQSLAMLAMSVISGAMLQGPVELEDEGVRQAQRLVRALRFDGGSEMALQIASRLSQLCLMALAMIVDRRIGNDPRSARLLDDAKRGAASQDQIEHRFRDIFDDALGPILGELPPSAASVLEFWCGFLTVKVRGDALTAYADRLREQGRNEEYEEYRRQMALGLLGKFLRTDKLEQAITSAKFESELRVTSTVVNALGAMTSAPLEEKPDDPVVTELARLRKAIAKLNSMMTGQNFQPVTHDWTKWAAGADGGKISGVVTPQPPGHAAGSAPAAVAAVETPAWILFGGLGAGVAALLVGLGVMLARGKRPQAPAP